MSKKGLFLVLTTAIISGFSIYITKYGVNVVNPFVFTFIKNGIVALALCAVCFLGANWKKFKEINKKQWGQLGLIGLIGGGVPFLLFFKGLSLTSAAQASFIHKTMFIYIAIIAVIFLKEKISKNFLIGALLIIVGNIFILRKLPLSFGRGDLLVLLATFLWAIENIISKKVLENLSGNIVAWGRMFFGSIFILIFLGATGQLAPIWHLSAPQIGWCLITAGLLLGYVVTWYNGLKLIPVSLAAAILMLGSPITTLLSLFSGGGAVLKDIVSSVLILIGVTIVIGGIKLLTNIISILQTKNDKGFKKA